MCNPADMRSGSITDWQLQSHLPASESRIGVVLTALIPQWPVGKEEGLHSFNRKSTNCRLSESECTHRVIPASEQ